MGKERRPMLLPSLFGMKCPNCRIGFVFQHKYIFPLSKTVALKENCEVCGQKLVAERNNGGGINYALTVVIFFLNLVWYWPIFGMSYEDDSIYYYLTTSIIVVVLLQPWLMRISRMLYLYLYIMFGTSPTTGKG